MLIFVLITTGRKNVVDTQLIQDKDDESSYVSSLCWMFKF